MSDKQNKPIKVFISYSWDSEEHKVWVKMLADRLSKEGFEVLLDQYLPYGSSLTVFMHDSLRKADKVLIIGTPNYKAKAEEHKGGTGLEDQIININMAQDISTIKFIPVLRKGEFSTSFTVLVGDRLGFDFRDDATFESEFSILLNSLA